MNTTTPTTSTLPTTLPAGWIWYWSEFYGAWRPAHSTPEQARANRMPWTTGERPTEAPSHGDRVLVGMPRI